MKFLAFIDYLRQHKYGFQPQRYVNDIHYRSVLFHQFGEQYRYACSKQHFVHEYDAIAYDVRQYEQRIHFMRQHKCVSMRHSGQAVRDCGIYGKMVTLK